MKKEIRDKHRQELAEKRRAQAVVVQNLCQEAARYLHDVRPQDRGKFLVWAIACLGDWDKSSKALTPTAIASVQARLKRAFDAWARG